MTINLQNDDVFDEIKLFTNKNKEDTRGLFLKSFYKEVRDSLNFTIDEVFHSINKEGVIRGIHFQKNFSPISKIVTCLDGEILDFYIDLRKESHTFGLFSSKILSNESNNSIFIPQGFGHGFSVLSPKATVLYLQSGDYNLAAEGGLNVMSLEFNWNVNNPIISERDRSHPDFDSGKNDWLDN